MPLGFKQQILALKEEEEEKTAPSRDPWSEITGMDAALGA